MAWQTAENLLKKRFNQHGIAGTIEAASLCAQAELLYPGLFRAVSVRRSVLHLELEHSQALPFKLIEGKLIEDLNRFAEHRKVAGIERVRLTFSD